MLPAAQQPPRALFGATLRSRVGDCHTAGSISVSQVNHDRNTVRLTSTALHSHMLNEEPRRFFMHIWANAGAVTLAKGLRATLNETASKLGS